jgi:DNA invertase Pin-like site-specific DNA recombinase
MRVYGYLRASTKEQDANRAKTELKNFAHKMGTQISCWFMEHESGTKLKRPELFRLLDVAEPGDILLVEQVDRISRLNTKDWETLKNIITEKGIKVTSIDLPTSHQFLKTRDEFSERMLSAINEMMLDMLAAIARKDYEDRKRRQAQGVQKAKELGKYKGRPIDKSLHTKIESLLKDKKSYSYIQNLLGCSRHTISKVKKSLKV